MIRQGHEIAGLAALAIAAAGWAQTVEQRTGGIPAETPPQHDTRMEWWREARFGMFIHWGLYAIPAGEWKGSTRHAEWIRHTAQVPIEEYDKLVGRFNPVKFNADEWVRMAKDAGMKYIVITSKHHDGFSLFDSEHTDYDIMSTPFKRDIMKELSEACAKAGLKMCWYHSIMDWHHPDYLPRRGWEKEQRPAGDADLDRYVAYMKSQIRELLTNYGPIGVMWFDGEWERTWNHDHGRDLYEFVRSISPETIINNRVDKGRAGMQGLTKAGGFLGDFGTPEQEIPPTGLPGVDWETCMTMNRHWGYNKIDSDWKTTEDLIRKLADIASKGGNFLLNVGPKADGTFPDESVERLREIGEWMKVNGESIYGTQASPFKKLEWGRCTQKALPDGNTRLYLHVFDWPKDGQLVVPGLFNEYRDTMILGQPVGGEFVIARRDDSIVIGVPSQAPDPINTVVVLDIVGEPDVAEPPVIKPDTDIFVGLLEVTLETERENVEIRYTTDGSDPTADSPVAAESVVLMKTGTVKARAFRGKRIVSPIASATYTSVAPRLAMRIIDLKPGLEYEYYEGEWDRLPGFDVLTPVKSGTIANFDFSPRERVERFGFRYSGYVTVPQAGAYTFYTDSDDGSQLFIGGELAVDNDGLHGLREASGVVALSRGPHPIIVTFFEKTGGDELRVYYEGPGIPKQPIPPEALSHLGKVRGRGGSVRLPIPTPRQMAWHEMELIAFAHFGMNTFTDREWGDGTEDPKLFNPSEFDAGQWARVLKDAGFGQLIVTAKHHDGFCLWPSEYTDHSVKSSPWRGGQGDIVGEVAEACRAAGLKFGVYLSPWDRHEPTYGQSAVYNKHFRNQLAELLTKYGPIHEVWFDGACGEGPNGKRQEYDWPSYIQVVRRLAPQAVIFSDAGPDVRWVGNERGYAGKTNWSTLRRGEFTPGTPKHAQLTEGHEDGAYWVPTECDVSIRPGWFYHAEQDGQVKSLQELLDIYYGSVGRGGVLLLNIPPDKRGLIHENDAARLRELREVLDETFGTNFAYGKLASSDNTRDENPAYHPRWALDGDRRTYWTPDEGTTSAWLTIKLYESVTFDRIMIQETIELGQRVRKFAVEAWIDGNWRQIGEGTTIGYKRLLRIEPVTASRVRLRILDAKAAPVIGEIGLFKASPRENDQQGS